MISEYTLSSEDESRYSRIIANFPHFDTEFVQIIVTGLTTGGYFKVLTTRDWIQINSTKYYFDQDYSSLRTQEFVGILNNAIVDSGVIGDIDNCSRIMLGSPIGFVLTDASYNVRILMGLHPFDDIETISVEKGIGYFMLINSVGVTMSTPILYLTSNIGQKTFRNNRSTRNIQSISVVMRLANSFSPGYPINGNNGEFAAIVPGNSLSQVEYILCDANLVEIELLQPLYLSVSIRPFERAEVKTTPIIPEPILPNNGFIGEYPQNLISYLYDSNNLDKLQDIEFLKQIPEELIMGNVYDGNLPRKEEQK